MPLEPVPDPSWWELVAHWRIRAKITKAALADACGVSRMQLYRIETGAVQATPEQIIAIEKAIHETLEKQQQKVAAA